MSKEEEWDLKEVVFVEDKQNSSIGVVLKVCVGLGRPIVIG